MSGLFKSKKQTPEYEVVQDTYGNIREPFTNWLSSQVGKAAPQYDKEIIAPMSGQEQQSLDMLGQYADQGTSKSTELARGELEKTMTGGYDPTSSPYYQAVKAESSRNLSEAQENVASMAGGGNRFWTGARLGQQGELATDRAIALDKLMGGLAETERDRRFRAIPMAQQMGEAEQLEPLQKATALQTLGALPRSLQQAQNEAAYNEWLRATQEYPLQIGQLATPFAGVQPTMAQVGYEQSPFSKYISPNLGLVGSSLSNIFAKK